MVWIRKQVDKMTRKKWIGGIVFLLLFGAGLVLLLAKEPAHGAEYKSFKPLKKITKKERDRYYSDSAFIGNSVSLGLKRYVNSGGKGVCGKPVMLVQGCYSFANDKKKGSPYRLPYRGRRYRAKEAVAAAKVERVFINMGSNDLWKPSAQTYRDYVSYIKEIRERNPKVVIFIQGTTPMCSARNRKYLNNCVVDGLENSTVRQELWQELEELERKITTETPSPAPAESPQPSAGPEPSAESSEEVSGLRLFRYSDSVVKVIWDRHKEAKYYHVYYSVDKETGYRLAGISKKEYFFVKNLKNRKKYYFYVRACQNKRAIKQEYIYYRTDHHWTTLGACYAYSAWAEKTGQASSHKLDYYKRETVFTDFYGTTYKKAPVNVPADSVELFHNRGDNKARVNMDDGAVTSDSIYFKEAASERWNRYEIFFSKNTFQIEVNTRADTGKTILLIKDSFANCFVPFLTEDYDRIIMIDYRYGKIPVGTILNIHKEITDVLVLFQTEKFMQNTKLEKLADIRTEGGGMEEFNPADFLE